MRNLRIASVVALTIYGCGSGVTGPVGAGPDGGADARVDALPEAAPLDAAEGGEAGGAGTDGGAKGCPAVQNNGAMCIYPTQCGPVVPIIAMAGAVPAAQGGTIAPGLYFLTQENAYGAGDGGTLGTDQYTAQLGTDTFAVNSYEDGFQDPPSQGTYTTMGTSFVRNYTCPTPITLSHPYTATASELTLYETRGSAMVEMILTKQ